ncbi:MAG: glycosyltransferase [Candidatus Rokuibacteriota bacterium]
MSGRIEAADDPGSPLVSVIIPCFNQARFLGEALASVARQTYSHHEVLVVDDGSTDDLEVVTRRAAGVRRVRQENQGTAVARNRGFRETRGRYVLFLDADDRLLPEALAIGVEALARHPACGLVYGHVRLIGDDGADCRCPAQQAVADGPYRELLSRNYVWTPGAALYPRAVLNEVGDFDPRAGGSADYDLNLRVARRWPIHCHGQVVLDYREHPASQSSDPTYMLRSAVSVRRRHRRLVGASPGDLAAIERGIRAAQANYGERLLDRLALHARAGRWGLALGCLPPLLRYHPTGLPRRIIRRLRRP